MTIRPLSKALKEKAEEEVNEVSDRTEDDLKSIKEWITKQPHLNARIENQWSLSFLRGCKFSLQRTKDKIDYFYTMRTLLPEFFKNRDPVLSDIQAILKHGVFLPLPNTKDMTGPRIILLRWSTCNPDIISLASMVKVYFMIMDILIYEDDNSMVAGVTIIGDYIDLKIGYVLQFTPSLIKKLTTCLQKAYPVRIKGICIFNCASIFETAFGMVRALMPEKLKNRMFLYSQENLKNVYTIVPQSLLPKEYGGKNGSVDEITVEWKKKVESYRDWYLKDEEYCTNEKLRAGQPFTTSDVFGVEGSFRKLDLD